MLTLLIAALSVVHTAAAAATAVPSTTARPEVTVVAEPARSFEHLTRARRALENGQLLEARREFVIASALDRDEGRVPVEAAFGLAQVMYSQFDEVGAARVLNALADDAATHGDLDTEARALTDAVWLNTNTKQMHRARMDAERLRVLLNNRALSPETRAYVAARVR